MMSPNLQTTSYEPYCRAALPDGIGRRNRLHLVGKRLMGPENLEKVLEKLATTDKTTLVCEKAPEGKIRVTSGSWDG